MIIDKPKSVRQLRLLWQQAFGDTDAFLDCFFSTGFSADRCRCVYEGNSLAAALYWFDCSWKGKKLAYLYAVATDRAFRGRGLCRKLMADTHDALKRAGYHGTILVPSQPSLFAFYEKLGYRACAAVAEFTCKAGEAPVPLQQIGPEAYQALRRQRLPENAVLQEDVTLDFLSTYATFYAGQALLLCAYAEEGQLTVCELLGASSAAPGILKALGCEEGKFRSPGKEKPFAMYHPLTQDEAFPEYFGIALD